MASLIKPVLDEVCRRSGRARSEVVPELLRRHLARHRFEQLRCRVMLFAEARGYLTDEDIFTWPASFTPHTRARARETLAQEAHLVGRAGEAVD